jgi:putative phage-type endonuclease
MIQGSQEWHEWRKNKIGASDAPIIMEVSPWKTPYQLWLEKLDLSQQKSPSFAMSRGIELEKQARKEFYKMCGIDVEPDCMLHKEHPWMCASFDGYNPLGYIVEIKCPGKTDHESAMCGVIPDKYYPQLQHQLAVSGFEMVYYFSYDGKDGVILECRRDDEYINLMIKKEREFYQCMTQLRAPELTDKDYNYRDDDEWYRAVIDYKEACKKIDWWTQQKEESRDLLIGMSGNQNSIGGGIRLQKIVKKGFIEYSRIPELQNIELDTYRKPCTEYWKIT